MFLDEYLHIAQPDKHARADAWQVAFGLQAVDGLRPSAYMVETARQHIEGELTDNEVQQRITAYYQTQEGRAEEAGTDEADGASLRIQRLLTDPSFVFSPAGLANIHRHIFSGVLPHAGKFRDYNISKKEWVLENASVNYAPFDWIKRTLEYDFDREKAFSYKHLSLPEVARHMAEFVSGIWQIHPFREGNTRTTAVFTIKYLRSLGLYADNEPFKEHAWYFRNALVRANYENYASHIERTTEFLELFFRNILMGEQNELKSRYTHIRWQGQRPHLAGDGRENTVQSSVQSSVQTGKSSVQIVAWMKQMPGVTAQQLADKLHLTKRAVEKQIAALRAAGVIRRVGPNKGGHWEIIQEETC
ncbi:MAG: Fic family protein [Paludibacteraceae bacterium]|nr:Fic family protein [Paludibacteraceae bacterium]